MGVYVMSDVHGEYKLFLKMLLEIDFKDTDKLIILGDVVDRGDKPIEILQYIMKRPNIELIRGNHEQMFIDYTKEEDTWGKLNFIRIWGEGVSRPTLDGFNKLGKDEQQDIVRYLKSTKLYKVVGNIILSHAGLSTRNLGQSDDIQHIMATQNEDDLMWSREEFYTKPSIKGYVSIFGHTPTPLIRDDIRKSKGSSDYSVWFDTLHKDKIGIDCAATFGGYLSCLRLEDTQIYYVSKEEDSE